MKEILVAIDNFNAVIGSYMKTKKMDQGHFLNHFIELLALIKKYTEGGILVAALSLAMQQTKSAEPSSDDDFGKQCQKSIKNLISALSKACDSIAPGTTLDNDEVLQSLRKVNKGFGDVLDRVQLESAITFQPVKGYAVEFVNQAKAYFQYIAILRAHNIRESALIKFVNDVIDTTNNPNSEERVVSIKSLIVTGKEVLKNPSTFHFFQFANASLAAIRLNKIKNISDHLLKLSTLVSLTQGDERTIQLMIDFSEQCIMPFQHKQPSPTLSPALLANMERWDVKMLDTLAALSRNVEGGVKDYCVPGYFQRKTQENDRIRDNMQILRISVSNISEAYKMFDMNPLTFDRTDPVYCYVRHCFLLEEVNILRDQLLHTFQYVVDNKHPVEAMFRGTFVGNTVTGSPEIVRTAVRDRINLKFQGPANEELSKLIEQQPQVTSPTP